MVFSRYQCIVVAGWWEEVAERGVSETVTFKDFTSADEGRLRTSYPRFSWLEVQGSTGVPEGADETAHSPDARGSFFTLL